MKMVSLGINVGASSIGVVIIKDDKIIYNHVKAHDGDPKKTLLELLKKIDIKKIGYCLITGRKFKEFVNIENMTEPEAIEYALDFLKLKYYDSIVSAGGENFIVYFLDKESKIAGVETGNKCASGTGEFFLQQIERMGLNKDEAIELGLEGIPHNISGRCSVFCKSDCTHALNKGEKKENVVAGLCSMMADKILDLLEKAEYKKVLLIGGTSKNKPMIKFLRNKIQDLNVPKEAEYFEAIGAAYAAETKKIKNKINLKNLFKKEASSFSFHKPLKDFVKDVEFKKIKKEKVKENDVCILGLDVGSTTTKSILLRLKDNSIIADCYLRTNGDPIGASVNCYKEMSKQIGKTPIKIIGLGVTGSGRQIAGLHALTKGVINEIIAHATAAAYFDKEVDTIFEIGGQDAKYTYLVNGVPSDYAMNEACSAGTGSFLEESAQQSLNIKYTQIGEIALKAKNPPNFNDQCAAFISSDIKNALHENLGKEDIVAGLVYSICMNYVNKVKGNRQIGKKVFMQGGVCYNKAVPIAMAALTGKKIIVPPEPGLVGAFGVALELKKRIELGLIEKQEFSLKELIDRKVKYHPSFKCPGDENKCDRKCEINIIEVENKKYPFGGACNKYYNQILEININPKDKNLITLRQKLVFEKYASLKLKEDESKNAKTIGISKSFMVNTFYPLYYNFFTKLGMKVILAKNIEKKGMLKMGSSFCYPVEIAHGLFQDLINKKPDYIFLPHITEIEVKNENFYKKLCVFVQSENYYLRNSFKNDNLPKLINPVISFSKGFEAAENDFIKIAESLGFDLSKAKEAYGFAVEQQRKMLLEFQEIGKKVLEEIEKNKRFAIVLFGRSYNAFASEANLNIPNKFSSRDRIIIPYDFLPIDNEEPAKHMYWAAGNTLLKASNYVKKNPLLFGCFITNFSCGPDSFIIGYFRNRMGNKPSLTLELDSHSADAGINTRIEAALDIFESYLNLHKKGLIEKHEENFEPVKILRRQNKIYVQSEGKEYPITDKKIKVIFPSMGELATKSLVTAFSTLGINCQELPIPTMETLKIGRAYSTCKECLPLILTTGLMLEYLDKRKDDEITIFFMAKTAGPCRQGQYHVFQENLIEKLKIKNVGILTGDDEKSFNEFGNKVMLLAWITMIISECFEDIRSVLRVLAENKKEALEIFNREFENILKAIKKNDIMNLLNQIKISSKILSKIKLTKPLSKAKIIFLTGEIYVRREEFSRLNLIEILEKNGFVVLIAPISEYLYYSNYLAKNNKRLTLGLKGRIKARISDTIQRIFEKRIKKDFSESGLIHYDLIEIEKTLDHALHLISKEMLGEAILTVGSSLKQIIDMSCGVIAIGPFGCMPNRVAESILKKEMNLKGKEEASKKKINLNVNELPFLAIESDGNLFPQIIQSRIEIFMLQANRLHEKIMETKQKEK